MHKLFIRHTPSVVWWLSWGHPAICAQDNNTQLCAASENRWTFFFCSQNCIFFSAALPSVVTISICFLFYCYHFLRYIHIHNTHTHARSHVYCVIHEHNATASTDNIAGDGVANRDSICIANCLLFNNKKKNRKYLMYLIFSWDSGSDPF